VVRDDRTLDGREVEPALVWKALTIETEHGGIIGQRGLKGVLKPANPQPGLAAWDADLHSPPTPGTLSDACPGSLLWATAS
jgi:hypothetical protein